MKDTWADRQLYSRIRIVQLRAGFLRIYESVSWEFGHKCEDLMSYGSFTFSLLAPILLFAMDDLVSCHLTDVVGGRGSTARPSLSLGPRTGNWFEQINKQTSIEETAKTDLNNKQTSIEQTARTMDASFPPGSLPCLLCRGAISLRFVNVILMRLKDKYQDRQTIDVKL